MSKKRGRSKYFILQQDPRIPEQPSVLACPPSIDPIAWCAGKALRGPRRRPRLKLSPRSGEYRGDFIDGLLPLFHDMLRDELVRLGVDNLQFFPVTLQDHEGRLEQGYSLVNIIGLLDAVDRGASTARVDDDGTIEALYAFSIDPAKTDGLRMFRVVGAPNLIIVDEALKEALDPAGVWMFPTERHDGWGGFAVT